METLRRWRSDVEAFLARLSARERASLAAAGLAIVAFVGFLVAHGVSGAIRDRQSRIEEKGRLLAQVGKLAQGWRAAQADRAQLDARLKGETVQLVTFVSQTGARLGVEVNDLRPGKAAEAVAGVVEETVEVDLAKIDPGKLAALLQDLERGPGVVKIRRLATRTRGDDPNAVDASFVVATYRLSP